MALFAGSLLSANAQTASEYLSAYVVPGAQKQLAIQLKNDVDYTACQMTITLPDGISFANDAALSGRSNAHQIKSQRSSDNKSMTVVLFSYDEAEGVKTGNLPFKKDKGAILLAELNIDENVTGTLSNDAFKNILNGITLSKVEFVKNEALEKNLALTLGKTGIIGDVNGVNYIDAQDASLVLQNAVHKLADNNANYDIDAADVNSDGSVTAQDASLLLQFSVNKITSFE